MRDYDIWVPRDAVASENDRRRDWALEIIRSSLGAEIRGTRHLSLAPWVGETDNPAQN